MKRICLFLIAFTLLLAGCNSNKVKVRGKVIGLQGTVKLLAEMPGQQGLVILAQQDVTDGNIDSKQRHCKYQLEYGWMWQEKIHWNLFSIVKIRYGFREKLNSPIKLK